MVRCSLIIAGYNEGERLSKTVQSCVETCNGLDYEIVISDDASTDGSVDNVVKRFPQVRVTRHSSRLGVSPTKDSGARLARGEVLVFLDGHVKPEPGAISRFVEDVELLDGQAIVTPTVADLDPVNWVNSSRAFGNGYTIELTGFQTRWIPLNQLRPREQAGRTFYECPALIGCACAVSRELYERLWGFDRQMFCWGLEDVDFGMKSWLMGYGILHDPEIRVGHRFQQYLTGYTVSWPAMIVNQLRTARKHFSESVWRRWVEQCRARYPQTLPDVPEGIWAKAWLLFQEQRSSVEAERAHLLGNRVRDEFWFADRFGSPWPKLADSARPLFTDGTRQYAHAVKVNGSNPTNGHAVWKPQLMPSSPGVHDPMIEDQTMSSQLSVDAGQTVWGPELMPSSPGVHDPMIDDQTMSSHSSVDVGQTVWGPELMPSSPGVHEPTIDREVMSNESSIDFSHSAWNPELMPSSPGVHDSMIDHHEVALAFSSNGRVH